MRAHWQYLKYVLRHKWFVFIECCKLGIVWRGITHDLTKFLPVEWGPYVNRFYGKGNSVAKAMQDMPYQCAWNHHQKSNDHHWQYWVLNRDDGSTLTLPMSGSARKEMLADWMGMSRAFGTSLTEWYSRNREKMQLHKDTRIWVEIKLGVFTAEDFEEFWRTTIDSL